MRLAIVSDIHGNALALDAVIADIEAQGADAVLCLGDLLSGPLDPGGTAERLMAHGWPTVRGNHDRYLVEHPEIGGVDGFVRASLSPAQLDWLAAIPATARFGEDVFLCHGTPSSDEGFWLDGPMSGRTVVLPDAGAVEAHAEGIAAAIMLCGHTHRPRSVRLSDGRMVVNPGAVGMQVFHGSPDARYALIERGSRGFSVGLRSVPYDHEAAAVQAEANGFGHWRDVLLHGWAAPFGLF